MKQRYRVIPRTLCFVFHKHQLLLIKGGNSKPWAGVHNCLGGHIEKGEDIVESANREIHEESGIKVRDTKLHGVVHVTNYFGNNILMFVTSSSSTTSKITSNHEGELVWVDFDHIDQLNIFDDIKPIMLQIIKHPHKFFTAVSHFDDQGNLIRLQINSK